MGGVVSRWKASKTDPPSNEEEKEDEAELTHALGFAWVTLATNDSYSLGALVLAHSLRHVNTAHKLAVLITPGVSPPMKEQLSTVFDVVKMVDVLDSKDEAHLALMKRPELGVTFTKIHCWRLTEFEKCVFLDADTLVIKNCDELFDREELSAAPDVGWPDCFNTGVFVFKPSIETFDNIIKFSLENGSFDGGDQGLLNRFFGDWATKDINKHLPFVYNLTSVALYSYIPAFKQYGSDARIVHFIGAEKPWLQQLDPQTRTVSTGPGTQHLAPMLQIWWNIFCDKVHPSATSSMECDSGMRNDEIEVCVNDNPIEPQPEIIQPFTPYIDKDDSRQSNLPYQNFDVKSTTGELLNITYLEKREQEMKEEEKRKDEIEERQVQEEVKEVNEEWKQDENQGEPEMMTEIQETTENMEVEEKSSEEPPANKEEESNEEHSEGQTPHVNPFSYETFFPDETCIQQYLQKNVMTYQPLDNNEKKQDEVIVMKEEQEHHLPRFLTIPEDDKRQSLNVYCRNDQEPSNMPVEEKADSKNHYNSENQNQILNKAESFEDCHLPEITSEPLKSKWKSLSNLESPPQAKTLEEVSFWKSHPNLNDPNKKYSMPKLKPILPKQNICQTPVTDVRPKVTQYTEFHMNCEHFDEVPCDIMGFVERHILEEVTQRIPNTETERLKSYIFPLGAMNGTKSTKEPIEMDENRNEMDCDLSLCERQKGNQPLQNVTRKRSNSCFLPVLKPIRPSKNEESKRLIRPGSRLSKERGTKAKIESRKAREKPRVESNIKKSSSNTSSVEDILKKLIDFSKDYQKYFHEYPEKKKEEKEALLGTVFRDVFAASTKDSPRIQYSKEFEEPPLSPFINGHSSGKTEDTTEGKESYAMNGYVTELMQKKKTNELYTRPKTSNDETNINNGTIALTDVNNELVERERTVRMVERSSNLSKDEIGPINGDDVDHHHHVRITNGVSSCSDVKEVINKPAEAHETNSLDLPMNQRNGTQSPEESGRTYASVAKKGDKTFRTIAVQSHTVEPKEKKSAKEQKPPSRTNKKKKKEQPQLLKQHVPIPPPSSPEVAKPVDKPVNLFNLLPEESSSKVILKPKKRKSKAIQSQSSQRRPTRKTKQDRGVVESLPTVDDGHIDNSGIAGAIAKLSIQPGGLSGASSEATSSAQEDYIRRQNWEMGTMDYMGRDSFDNIWSKICETIDGKVTKDLNSDGVSTAPSSEVTTPQNDDVKSEKSQVPSQESPEKMTEQRSIVPPDGSDTSTSTGTISSEITAKASDIAFKATEALEAFGKLFVSGPVAIKSEVAEDGQKSPETGVPAEEKKAESLPEEATSAELKKSTELDEEGKSKKGVINKILELVGVGKPETSTAVFYDKEQPESEKSKEDRGNSVFYDKEMSPGETALKEELKLSSEAVESGSKVRAPSPSLTLKTTPGTEVVSPTPPPTPMTTQIGLKDDKMLTVDDTIKATPPVTDKNFDDVPKADAATIKAQVDNIIDEAKKLAESKLQESKTIPQTPAPPTSMALVPRMNEALEVFGKMFVSGPVTIKSEIPEEVQKVTGTAKTEVEVAKVAGDAVKPAIPMPGIPMKITEPTAPVTAEGAEGFKTVIDTMPTAILPQTEPPKTETTTSQPTEPVALTSSAASEPTAGGIKSTDQPSPVITEAVVPITPETVMPPPAVAPKTKEPSTINLAGAAAAAVDAVSDVLTKAKLPSMPNVAQMVADTILPAAKPIPPETEKSKESSTPNNAESGAAAVGAVAAALTKTTEPAAPVTEATAPVTPQPTESATPVTEPAAPVTPQPTESATPVTEPAAPVTPQSTESATPVTEPAAPVTPQPTESVTPPTQLAAESTVPVIPEVTGTSASIPESEVTKTAEPAEPVKEQVKESQAPTTAQKAEVAMPSSAQSTPTTEVPSKEFSKPSETKTLVAQQIAEKTAEAEKVPKDQKTESSQSLSTVEKLSKANEALEAFGKHFVSGPVVLKSEVAEPTKPAAPEKPASKATTPAKDPEPSEGHSKASEALEAFGKSFISGPVTLKSEIPEEVKTPAKEETDAVHRFFQSKPEDEPIYSNIEEVEEIKVTSEEERKKEKPQSSKLTEQILKAIPPEMRKPFSEASQTVSSEVAQLLSSAEQQTTSILLDKPITEMETPVSEEGDTSGPSVPPVPPRRNRSKGRDAPQPPPKKKGKNGKD